MHFVAGILVGIPPLAVYVLVGTIIGVESMGVPVPGEITLVAASLLAASQALSPWGVAIAASSGAIIGDSIGYVIGRRGGRPLLERLGRRFPRHMGPRQLAQAERTFDRWGAWAVFFGRFVALLRIFAGPLAGTLRMPYYRFLVANATGGVFWAFLTTFLIYYLGQVAEKWLNKFSWVALVIAIAAGIASTIYLRHRAAKHARDEPESPVVEIGTVETVAAPPKAQDLP